ncbi:MAG TPA: TonB-dependent receptor [Candidatus Saccharimonadaceae bacterium]|nr:TonB-dependent receptor [Candidatus Saccharimonadaceae bacterium]
MIASLLLAVAVIGAEVTPADSLSAAAPDSVRASGPDSLRASAPDSLRAAPADSARVAVPRPVLTLPEVRVDRERERSEARRLLPTASLTELPVGVSNRATESLSEVLAGAAGVHIEQYGGLGAFSTVSLRGAPPGQVTVFLDGAPLTSAAHGAVNLADLPVGALERVEVYRGLAPLGLGVATPGGAIQLITASSPVAREARVARGSFDTWEGRATGGAARGAFSALAHVGFQSSRGDFPYLDDNGTPFNLADDTVHPRWNNRFDSGSALVTLHWTPSATWRVTAREDAFHKAQGVPGQGANPALHPRLTFLRSLSQLEAVRAGGRFVPEVRASESFDGERTRFRDVVDAAPPYEIGPTRHDSNDRIQSTTSGARLLWSELPAGFSLETGASLRAERADLADPIDGYRDPPESRRTSEGAMAALQWRGLRERLTLHAARRWDRLEDHLRSIGVANLLTASDVTRQLDSPQLGARLALPFDFDVHGNWSRAQRAPDFLELFGNQGVILGNPTLRPESGESWDAGAGWSRRFAHGLAASLEWTRDVAATRDLILYVRNSLSTTKAQNVSHARIRGHELTLRLAAREAVVLSGSFTWQSALDDGSVATLRGKRLPQRPGRQAYLRADVTRRALRVSADVQYMGDNYLDPYNVYRVSSRTLVGASASHALPLGLRLVVEGKNLGDNRVADVGGFPLPGRSVWVACEMRLGSAGPIQKERN